MNQRAQHGGTIATGDKDFGARDDDVSRQLGAILGEWNHPDVRTLGPEGRDIIGRVLAAAVSRHYPKHPIPPKSAAVAAEMRQSGVAELGRVLDETQVSDVVSFLQDRPCYNSHYQGRAPGDGIGRFAGKDADRFRFGSYRKEDILAAPHLLEVFLRDDILAAVEAFLGAWPMLFSVNAFWSFPQTEPPSYGQDFHRDLSHPKFCVLFLYLTDVTETTGAHQYICKTQSVPILQAYLDGKEVNRNAREFFMLGEDGLGFTDLYERYFSELVKTIGGKAGCGFLEDAYGVHRGLPPKDRPRLLAWARYSLFSTPPDLEMADRHILGSRYPEDEWKRYALRGIVD